MTDPRKQRVDVFTALSIYDGQTLLGYVSEQRCGRYAAYDSDRRFLGEFANRTAAMDAINAQTSNRRT